MKIEGDLRGEGLYLGWVKIKGNLRGEMMFSRSSKVELFDGILQSFLWCLWHG